MKSISTRKIYYLSLIIGGLFICTISNVKAQKVKLKVSEMMSKTGKIVIILFKDNETFRDEKGFRRIEFKKDGLVNGEIELNFTIEPGIYGITLLDDEDSNGVMNKNMIGIPKEGFGFSNFYLTRMQRPHFDEFKTEITAGQNVVVIRVKYI